MSYFKYFNIDTKTDKGAHAAKILKNELQKRGLHYSDSAGTVFVFSLKSEYDKDSYEIEQGEGSIVFYASGIRGFMFAIGNLLRKIEYSSGSAHIISDISGIYSPNMKIRGHQLGYRTTANSYESWDIETMEQYIIELMFFGVNTIENTVFEEKAENYNPLMKYTQKEYVKLFTQCCDSLDADTSFWYPNDDKSIEEGISDRLEYFKDAVRVNYFFPPGGDPGKLSADEFIRRTIAFSKEIKKQHKEALCYPSAQAPHNMPGWGDTFIKEMEKLPREIDGVITGPNWAMPLDELRKRLPVSYPIRLYPDITHNVRCEYPVHFDRDDWHYTYAATLSRESINPRPCEMAKLHSTVAAFIEGSVSYSEGINDDVNKAVWSALDFNPNTPLNEIIADYCRLHFYGADTKKIAEGIFCLEANWERPPETNPIIDYTFELFESVSRANPSINENYRFLMLHFRAMCDYLIKKRRCFELYAVKKAKELLLCGSVDKAMATLSAPMSEDYNKLRERISSVAHKLFTIIGLQLSTYKYYANDWERGATLDTIDNPITDRLYLIDRINYAKTLPESERAEFFKGLIYRNNIEKDEFYFSFANDDFSALGTPQDPYFYMDFQGDRPNVNNGTIPMSMVKVFDHYTFKMKIGNLTANDYTLMINIKPKYKDIVKDFDITINGKTLYHGKQYGGERNLDFEKKYLAPGFETICYKIPHDFIENGYIDLVISEPIIGITIAEVFVLKTKIP